MLGTPIHRQWEYKIDQQIGTTVGQFLTKPNIYLYDLAIMLLCIYPNELEIQCAHKHQHTYVCGSFVHHC